MNWIRRQWMPNFLANPLLVKEIRLPTRLNARKILKLGFGIGLVVSILSAVSLLFTYDTNLIILFTLIYGVIVISVAPFIAYTAAILTVNNMRAEQFDLLYLTTIRDARLIEGYILSACYRCRGFFAVLIGIAPFVITWATYLSVYSGYIRCLQYDIIPASCELPSPMLLPVALISFIVLSISLIGVYIFSASLGVFFAVLAKSRLLSGIAAVIVSLIAICSVIVILMSNDLLNTLLASLFYVPFPYLLSLSAVMASQPLARKKV
jgi:hypothetical protein